MRRGGPLKKIFTFRRLRKRKQSEDEEDLHVEHRSICGTKCSRSVVVTHLTGPGLNTATHSSCGNTHTNTVLSDTVTTVFSVLPPPPGQTHFVIHLQDAKFYYDIKIYRQQATDPASSKGEEENGDRLEGQATRPGVGGGKKNLQAPLNTYPPLASVHDYSLIRCLAARGHEKWKPPPQKMLLQLGL